MPQIEDHRQYQNRNSISDSTLAQIINDWLQACFHSLVYAGLAPREVGVRAATRHPVVADPHNSFVRVHDAGANLVDLLMEPLVYRQIK